MQNRNQRGGEGKKRERKGEEEGWWEGSRRVFFFFFSSSSFSSVYAEDFSSSSFELSLSSPTTLHLLHPRHHFLYRLRHRRRPTHPNNSMLQKLPHPSHLPQHLFFQLKKKNKDRNYSGFEIILGLMMMMKFDFSSWV
ncbi:unnamed protein product [Camellia sinensis]